MQPGRFRASRWNHRTRCLPTPPTNNNQETGMDTLDIDRLTKLEGIGCSRKRREDPRFIQGKGNYVDDITMPGMLFGALVRSSYAHARIVSIDNTRAPALHRVIAVN